MSVGDLKVLSCGCLIEIQEMEVDGVPGRKCLRYTPCNVGCEALAYALALVKEQGKPVIWSEDLP